MRKKLQTFLLILTMGTMLSLTTGCAAKKALEQPDKKDMSVLEKGTPRVTVIQEIGQPNHTQENNDRSITDTHSFLQGYTKISKVGRAIGHGVMDILTHGLWEIIGVPTENTTNGNQVDLEIKYDTLKLVEKVTYIKNTETIKSSQSKKVKHEQNIQK
jgi:hypothetical protein